MIRLPFFHRIQRYIALPIAHPCAFEYCPRRLPVSLPCLCLLRFGSTNNYHRSGTKSTDFFGRSEYFLSAFTRSGKPYSLFTAAQFLRLTMGTRWLLLFLTMPIFSSTARKTSCIRARSDAVTMKSAVCSLESISAKSASMEQWSAAAILAQRTTLALAFPSSIFDIYFWLQSARQASSSCDIFLDLRS